MVKKRLAALARALGTPALSFFSIFGLFSIFAVHVAGFLSVLPRSLWPFVDVYFVSGFLTRFSFVLAISLLAARYSPYMLSSIAGTIWSFLLCAWLCFSRRGRRLIRSRGWQGSVTFAMSLDRTEQKHGYKYDSIIRSLVSNRYMHFLVGILYFGGRAQGYLEARVQQYSIAIQMIASTLTLSFLYVSPFSGFRLACVTVLLIAFFPPGFLSSYLSRPYLFFGVKPLAYFELESLKFFSWQKFTVIALTVSFLAGLFHHQQLISGKYEIATAQNDLKAGTIVLVSALGVVLYSEEKGYWLLSSILSEAAPISPSKP